MLVTSTLFKSRLTRRLVIWMAGTASLIFTIGIISDYRLSREHIIRNSELEARQVVAAAASDLEAVFLGVQRATDLFARVLGDKQLPASEMDDLLRRTVDEREDLYGSAIALDPQASGFARGFSPYYYHDGGRLQHADLAQTYPRGYVQEPWFRLARQSGHAIWTEPYFDADGGRALMTTYSVPIYRRQAGEPVFFGVVTADITLKSIQSSLQRIHLGKTGFAFMVSREGSLISYPDDRYLLQTFPTVFPVIANDRDWQHALFTAQEGGSGILSLPCVAGEGKCLLAFSPFGNTGWSLMVLYPEEEMLAELNSHLHKVIAITVICLFLLLLSVILISRSITRPLLALTAAADRLGSGDLETALPEPEGDDEVAHLVTAFRHMKHRLREFIARIEQDTASRNRLQGELDAAQQIQMEMLPQAGNARVDAPTHEIHARLIPAKTVGGDLYSWFRPDEDQLFLIIGDVSDKGVPAALFMARVVTLLQQHLVGDESPPQVLSLLNQQLVERNDACMFATLSCALVNLLSGEVEWASAGHSAPLLRRQGGVTVLAQENGPALGLLPVADFPVNRLQLEPSDLLLFCTDGIDEAFNTAREQFGMERLAEVLQATGTAGVHAVGETVLEAVHAHAGEEAQSDDITLLVFAWKGERRTLIDRSWTVFSSQEFPATLPAFERMCAWLGDWGSEQGLSEEVVHDLRLVAEELFVNIVHYGGLARGSLITLLLARNRDEMAMEFIDAGTPWNPLADAPAPELGQDSAETEIGGLGVHLVCELTQEQRYRRLLSENRFCVLKQLQ